MRTHFIIHEAAVASPELRDYAIRAVNAIKAETGLVALPPDVRYAYEDDGDLPDADTIVFVSTDAWHQRRAAEHENSTIAFLGAMTGFAIAGLIWAICWWCCR